MRNDLCAVAHVLTHARPRGVPLPHRGYTFDSAGLASATQPTLGNNVSEEATPLGVVLSFAHIITHPNEIVGAVPVCPPERPRSGVSIPRTCALCVEILTMDAPLLGDTGGHTGTAPTTLRNIFPHIPHKQNNLLRTIHPNDINHLHTIPPKRNA